MQGSFVYMLLCRDEGPIYVKIGMTDSLHSRFLTLVKNSRATPRRLCSFEVHSRRKARMVESDLLEATHRWSCGGEWLEVGASDKADLNCALRAVIENHRSAAWPCVWEQFPVAGLLEEISRRKSRLQHDWSKGFTPDVAQARV
jgi:hypothetical protein